jgi:hypothetical protein
MRAAFLFAALGGLAIALSACGGMRVQDFEGAEPKLVLENYFVGHTTAYGVFEDRFGDLRRQFVVRIDGTWSDGTLTLDEDFAYKDGETARRVWTIRKLDEHTYEGTADDVIGAATGKAYGNVFNWSYSVDLPVGEDTWRVHFDDWLYLMGDGILINRARVTKWGIEVGTVTLVFTKYKNGQSAIAPTTGETGLGRSALQRLAQQ